MWTQATLPKKVEWLGKLANWAKKKKEEKNMRKKSLARIIKEGEREVWG